MEPPAIPPEKSNSRHSNFETKYPKAIVVPAHFYIEALVVYPRRRLLLSTSQNGRSRVRSTVAYGRLNRRHNSLWLSKNRVNEPEGAAAKALKIYKGINYLPTITVLTSCTPYSPFIRSILRHISRAVLRRSSVSALFST